MALDITLYICMKFKIAIDLNHDILKAIGEDKERTCIKPTGFVVKPIVNFRNKDFCFVHSK